MGMPKMTSGSDKIDGMDGYEVREAARTLMEAVKIKRKAKLYKAAKKEALKIAKDALKAAKEGSVDADKVKKETY